MTGQEGGYGGILAGLNNNSGGNRLLVTGDFKNILFQINSSLNTTYYYSAGLANDWHHLAATYNGTTIQLYLDGSPVGTPTSTSATLVSATSGMFIGWGSPSIYHFAGNIRDVAVFDVGLTSTDIANIRNNGVRSIATVPVGYWRLDENFGTAALDSVGSRHGTLINSPLWINEHHTLKYALKSRLLYSMVLKYSLKKRLA
jgi:hypothetical protein